MTGAVSGVIGAIGVGLSAIKNRVLGTITGWARRIPGYDLLCYALGRDPIADRPVERNAQTLISALLAFVPGGQALWANLQQSGALTRAFAWLSEEIPKLGLTWDAIRGLFSRAWDALGASDLLDLAGAWQRLSGIFGPPLARLRTFAGAAALKIAEFVFETVAGGGVMGIIRRAGDAFRLIVNNPIGFARNLISAVRGGLGRFMANIASHLRTGLFAWLTGALRGAIQLPQRFDLPGIVTLVLNVLGLTWAAVRTRLVRLLGEPVVRAVETAVDWIQRIVTGGLGAVADRILEFASGLVDTVLGGIRDWVARSVVGAAITRLITMFNPAGAVIGAIVAVYNTVQFFIERAQQLGVLAQSVFTSITAIATGNLGNAITAVEQAMARTLPVVLGFLARLIGLGDIAAPIRRVIDAVRTPIGSALDRVADWLAGLGRRIVGAIRGQRAQPTPAPAAAVGEIPFVMKGRPHRLVVRRDPRPKVEMHSDSPFDLWFKCQSMYDALVGTSPAAGTPAGQRALRQELIQAAFTLKARAGALHATADPERLTAALPELAREIAEFGERFDRRDIDAEAAAAAEMRAKARQQDPVLGLFEGIDESATRHGGWIFQDLFDPPWTEGRPLANDQAVTTRVTDPAGNTGSIRRRFNRSTGTWTLVSAFLDDCETWVPAHVPLSSRGINLITYATLRQQKLMGLGQGQQSHEIRHQKWSSIVNEETVLQLQHWTGGSASRFDETIVRTHSWMYAMTALTQARYRVVADSQRVIISGSRVPIGRALSTEASRRKDGDDKFAENLAQRYPGLTLATPIYEGFDIEADVEPLR